MPSARRERGQGEERMERETFFFLYSSFNRVNKHDTDGNPCGYDNKTACARQMASITDSTRNTTGPVC